MKSPRPEIEWLDIKRGDRVAVFNVNYARQVVFEGYAEVLAVLARQPFMPNAVSCRVRFEDDGTETDRNIQRLSTIQADPAGYVEDCNRTMPGFK